MDEAINMPLGPLLFLYRKQPKKVNQLQTRIISSERREEEDGKGGHLRQRHLRQCHENHCSQWRTVSQGASPTEQDQGLVWEHFPRVRMRPSGVSELL